MFNLEERKRKKHLKILQEFKHEKDKLGFFDAKYINEISETKYGEFVVISFPEDVKGVFNITVYLTYPVKRKTRTIRMYLIFKPNGMLIADILNLDKNEQNRGYGSLMMEQAIRLAKQRNMRMIYGNMVYENPAHRERQVHFYSKHGFEIDENDKIQKVLIH